MNHEIIKDRMLGCLYGQAIGDALGLGTEFMSKQEVLEYYPYSLTRYDQIIQDYHRCKWHRGAWTDDTDMMICIMTAFDGTKFDDHNVAQNFKDWFNGDCKDIGCHIFSVLCMDDYVKNPQDCSKLQWELSNLNSAANGALMRTSVVGLAKDQIEEQAETICRLTHYDPRCVGSCVIASLIIHNLVWNDTLLSYEEIWEIGERYDERIAEWIDLAYTSPDISSLDLDHSESIGYTLRTLSAALWCYWHAQSFQEGLSAVVNEGGDADTNAAIACAILGAMFGYSSIPEYYIENLYHKESFYSLAEHFITDVLVSQNKPLKLNLL